MAPRSVGRVLDRPSDGDGERRVWPTVGHDRVNRAGRVSTSHIHPLGRPLMRFGLHDISSDLSLSVGVEYDYVRLNTWRLGIESAMSWTHRDRQSWRGGQQERTEQSPQAVCGPRPVDLLMAGCRGRPGSCTRPGVPSSCPCIGRIYRRHCRLRSAATGSRSRPVQERRQRLRRKAALPSRFAPRVDWLVGSPHAHHQGTQQALPRHRSGVPGSWPSAFISILALLK